MLQNLKKLIKKKRFDEASKFAEKCDLVNQYINLLTTNRDYKKAFKYLSRNKMDYKTYPGLEERAYKSHVRYLIKKFEWVLKNHYVFNERIM